MTAESNATLESQRDKVEQLLKNGCARNLRLDALLLVYKAEINPDIVTNINDGESVMIWLKELYEAYDKQKS